MRSPAATNTYWTRPALERATVVSSNGRVRPEKVSLAGRATVATGPLTGRASGIAAVAATSGIAAVAASCWWASIALAAKSPAAAALALRHVRVPPSGIALVFLDEIAARPTRTEYGRATHVPQPFPGVAS